MIELKDKIAIVTGGGRGLGRAIVLGLARCGVKLVIPDINVDNAGRVAGEARSLGSAAVALEANVSHEADVERIVAETLHHFGKVDILVNNAGIMKGKPTPELSLTEWDEMLAVHLNGTFLCCRAALKPMMLQRSGAIVSMSSGLGAKGAKGAAHYGTAKAGIMGFTKSIAQETAPYGIRVNAIAPGPMDTDLLRGSMSEEEYRKSREERGRTIPMGRVGSPEDVVGPVIFLVSDMSRYVTGQILHVNGGGHMP
jgi:NAD(P)-dependent dehydrogenase (short-subunit alcohol dehydrogenase family)